MLLNKGKVGSFAKAVKLLWIVTAVLFTGLIVVPINFRQDLVVYFKGNDSTGPIIDQAFIVEFALCQIIIALCSCAYLVYRLNAAKILPKAKILLVLFLISLFFNSGFACVYILTLGLFDLLHFDISLFNIYLASLTFYLLGSFFVFDKMVKTLKRQEWEVSVVSFVVTRELKRLLSFYIPSAIIFACLSIFVDGESRILFLTLISLSIISLYSSTVLLVHIAQVLDKLFKLLRRKLNNRK